MGEGQGPGSRVLPASVCKLAGAYAAWAAEVSKENVAKVLLGDWRNGLCRRCGRVRWSYVHRVAALPCFGGG